MRADLELVAGLVPHGARVLDLGCGDGQLLAHLASARQVIGYGIEIQPDPITACIARGVNVIQHDLDDGLGRFGADSFDLVLMTEALQAVRNPAALLADMLRVAPQCIVTFPNFGHWQCRWWVAVRGRMPVSSHLPHRWYDTPNIHLCTFSDFEALCAEQHVTILKRRVVDHRHMPRALNRLAPNLFGHLAFYHLSRPPAGDHPSRPGAGDHPSRPGAGDARGEPA